MIATDIECCGCIGGIGTLNNDSPRAFVLIPMDMCPGDLVSGSSPYPDGVVNVSDMLYVINKWSTSDCVADITEDNTVSTPDLLAVINHWGPCSCFPTTSISSATSFSSGSFGSQFGLSEAQWEEYMGVLLYGTESEIENYNCWAWRYLSDCSDCPTCRSNNPFHN